MTLNENMVFEGYRIKKLKGEVDRLSRKTVTWDELAKRCGMTEKELKDASEINPIDKTKLKAFSMACFEIISRLAHKEVSTVIGRFENILIADKGYINSKLNQEKEYNMKLEEMAINKLNSTQYVIDLKEDTDFRVVELNILFDMYKEVKPSISWPVFGRYFGVANQIYLYKASTPIKDDLWETGYKSIISMIALDSEKSFDEVEKDYEERLAKHDLLKENVELSKKYKIIVEDRSEYAKEYHIRKTQKCGNILGVNSNINYINNIKTNTSNIKEVESSKVSDEIQEAEVSFREEATRDINYILENKINYHPTNIEPIANYRQVINKFVNESIYKSGKLVGRNMIGGYLVGLLIEFLKRKNKTKRIPYNFYKGIDSMTKKRCQYYKTQIIPTEKFNKFLEQVISNASNILNISYYDLIKEYTAILLANKEYLKELNSKVLEKIEYIYQSNNVRKTNAEKKEYAKSLVSLYAADVKEISPIRRAELIDSLLYKYDDFIIIQQGVWKLALRTVIRKYYDIDELNLGTIDKNKISRLYNRLSKQVTAETAILFANQILTMISNDKNISKHDLSNQFYSAVDHILNDESMTNKQNDVLKTMIKTYNIRPSKATEVMKKEDLLIYKHIDLLNIKSEDDRDSYRDIYDELIQKSITEDDTYNLNYVVGLLCAYLSSMDMNYDPHVHETFARYANDLNYAFLKVIANKRVTDTEVTGASHHRIEEFLTAVAKLYEYDIDEMINGYYALLFNNINVFDIIQNGDMSEFNSIKSVDDLFVDEIENESIETTVETNDIIEEPTEEIEEPTKETENKIESEENKVKARIFNVEPVFKKDPITGMTEEEMKNRDIQIPSVKDLVNRSNMFNAVEDSEETKPVGTFDDGSKTTKVTIGIAALFNAINTIRSFMSNENVSEKDKNDVANMIKSFIK